MARLKRNTLKRISEYTGISTTLLCDYVARRKYPSRKRAQILDKTTSLLKCHVTAFQWLLGSKEQIMLALNAVQPVSNPEFQKALETVN